MSNGKSHFPAFRLVALAVAVGALAGAFAVYVIGGLDGNTGAGTAPPGQEIAGEDVAACAAKEELAKKVGASAQGHVAAMLAADPPRPMGDLAFDDPQGKPMTLADLSGKTVLLNLWATWCAPCRAEMPALDALQKDLGSDGFEVVAVNVDTGDDTKPRKFLDETGVETLAFYRDDTIALFNELKTRGLALGLPVTLLIDEEGCLLAHMNGPAEWAGEDARRLIATARGKG